MKEYTFTIDDREVLKQKGDFSFVVGIYENIDPEEVRKALNKISQNIGYATYLEKLNVLVCVTDENTWEEKLDGKIPEGLEKMVYTITENVRRK